MASQQAQPALVDQDAIRSYIAETFADTHAVVADDDTFFLYADDEKFPFATIVTKDNDFDNVSNLHRPGVFRLNVGVSKQTFQALFGAEAAPPAGGAADADIDYTALDQLFPHPVYGRMHWLSVLNPSYATFERVKPLLEEAYQRAVRRRKR
jgi:hypothetical protein